MNPRPHSQIIRDHLDVFERSGFQFAEATPSGKGYRPLRPRPASAAPPAASSGDPGDGVSNPGEAAAGVAASADGSWRGSPGHAEGAAGGELGGGAGRDGSGSCFGQGASGAASEGRGGGGSGDLLLSAVPYSKGVQFGEEEVAEMVEALAAGEGRREAVRPKKWVGDGGRGCAVHVFS